MRKIPPPRFLISRGFRTMKVFPPDILGTMHPKLERGIPLMSTHPEPHHEHEKHVGNEPRQKRYRFGEKSVAPLSRAPETPRRKSQRTAGLLSIFLGWAGAARFYLGSPWFGVAQIVASILTIGIAGIIWGAVEGVIILSGTHNLMTTDAQGNYLE